MNCHAPFISVIVCTHNPREDYLTRVIDALKEQTLPRDRWELIVVDNGSQRKLAVGSGQWAVAEGEKHLLDLGWHAGARVVREDKLGLTQARLRGIAEAKGELLVFVDDDNVLAPDYLEVAMEISGRHPNLGAWSGQVLPEFEVAPPDEIAPFLEVLCIRPLSADSWGNYRDARRLPFGAGMVVREGVARAYAKNIAMKPARLALDRSGQSLASSGDLDLALTSVDLGMGTGLFRSLVLTHLIASRRLRHDYILKLIEDSTYGHAIFEKERDLASATVTSGMDRLVVQYKLWRATPMQKAVAAARARGLQRAKQLLS
jgi:hypothetical protein